MLNGKALIIIKGSKARWWLATIMSDLRFSLGEGLCIVRFVKNPNTSLAVQKSNN